MIRALIFDFDGLILDTEWPDYLSWQEQYQAMGCELPLPLWIDSIGTDTQFDPYALLAELSGCAVDTAAVRAARRARMAELIEAEEPLPGVLDYLDAAKRRGLKVGVASSSPRVWVEGYLEQHGLAGLFDCVKCSDDVPRVKPDPALYLAALAALDVPPTAALALEDSLNGLAAAKAAGLYCVVVPNRLMQEHTFEQADLRLASLAEMSLESVIQFLTAKQVTAEDAKNAKTRAERRKDL